MAAEEGRPSAIATSDPRYFLDRQCDHRWTFRRRTYSRRETLPPEHAACDRRAVHDQRPGVASLWLSVLEARTRSRDAGAFFGRLHAAHHRPDVLPRLARLHHHAHSVFLDNSDRRFGSDEFAFGYHVDNVIRETRFSAGAQRGLGGALHSRRHIKRSREYTWCTCERRTGRIRRHEREATVEIGLRQISREDHDNECRGQQSEKQIPQRDSQHIAGREKGFAGDRKSVV